MLSRFILSLGIAMCALCTHTAVAAGAQGDSTPVQVKLFTGVDLTTAERHLTIISYLDSPSILTIAGGGSKERTTAVFSFTCSIPEKPVAFWQVAEPYTMKASLPKPGAITVAVVPTNQSLSEVTVVLGCRAASRT